LSENFFIVPNEFDEIKFLEQVRNVIKLIDSHNKYVNRFTILPTTGCNARCYYCFEAGAKIYSMDEKTAVDVADYIIKKSQGNAVKLNWFGGEPLCNIKAIDIISQKLMDANIKYASNMVSNSYLFDEKIVDKAVNLWHLKRISITLDGLEETYNRVKSFVNNDTNAFKKVLNNIEMLAKQKILVNIRMNMTRENSEELFQLTEFLNEKFSGYDNITPYPAVIYEDLGYSPVKNTDDERKILHDDFIRLVGTIKKPGKGYKNYMGLIKTYSCQADDPHAVMILPNGGLGFCEHFVDCDTFSTIYEDKDKPFWSESIKAKEKCKKCPCYPTCLCLSKCPPHGGELCYEYEYFMRNSTLKNIVKTYYEEYKLNKNSKAGSLDEI